MLVPGRLCCSLPAPSFTRIVLVCPTAPIFRTCCNQVLYRPKIAPRCFTFTKCTVTINTFIPTPSLPPRNSSLFSSASLFSQDIIKCHHVCQRQCKRGEAFGSAPVPAIYAFLAMSELQFGPRKCVADPKHVQKWSNVFTSVRKCSSAGERVLDICIYKTRREKQCLTAPLPYSAASQGNKQLFFAQLHFVKLWW